MVTGLFCFGLIWYKLGWKFFDKTLDWFHPYGVISYVIYISHWPFVCQARYLGFIEIPYVASMIYLVICLIFSYLVERVIYPKLNILSLKLLFPSKYKARLR